VTDLRVERLAGDSARFGPGDGLELLACSLRRRWANETERQTTARRRVGPLAASFSEAAVISQFALIAPYETRLHSM